MLVCVLSRARFVLRAIRSWWSDTPIGVFKTHVKRRGSGWDLRISAKVSDDGQMISKRTEVWNQVLCSSSLSVCLWDKPINLWGKTITCSFCHTLFFFSLFLPFFLIISKILRVLKGTPPIYRIYLARLSYQKYKKRERETRLWEMCTSMECKSLAFRKPCGYSGFAIDPMAFIGAPSFFSLLGGSTKNSMLIILLQLNAIVFTSNCVIE